MWTIASAYDQARTEAAARPRYYRDMADLLLRTYAKAMPGMTREQIGEALDEFNRQRLDAQPSLAKFPELRGMRELIAAQWRGTRDGAGLDPAQAAVNVAGLSYYHRVLNGGMQLPAQCTCEFFPASDRGPLLANNLDSTKDEPFTEPVWPALSEHLVIGSVSSGVFLDEESPELFPAPVWKLVGRYCRSTAEAVEMLTRYNHFWGPCNALVADRNNDVAMIEKTACRIAVRRSRDGFGFVTAMTQEDPDLRRFVAERRAASLKARGLSSPCADTRYWDAQDARRTVLNRLLDDARANPTLETLRAMMQYRGPDGLVAGNGDVLHPGDPGIEHTLRTQIFCLAEGRTLWWARDNARDIPSWENRREDVTFKDVWLW